MEKSEKPGHEAESPKGDDVLRRMLKTPPKPNKGSKKAKGGESLIRKEGTQGEKRSSN